VKRKVSWMPYAPVGAKNGIKILFFGPDDRDMLL
jgi:hypothetical protein